MVVIVALWMGWIPTGDGGSGIDVYILDKNLEPLAIVEPNTTYNMQIGTLGVLTYNGQQVGGLGFSLWVKPSGGESGIVTIDWTGWRYIGEIGGSATSGSKNVPWDTKTELIWDKLTDSWIQVTTSTLEIWGIPQGSHILKVNYDVTATGAIDGVPKQATAAPSVDCNITWSAGTLSLETGIITTTLEIV